MKRLAKEVWHFVDMLMNDFNTVNYVGDTRMNESNWRQSVACLLAICMLVEAPIL